MPGAEEQVPVGAPMSRFMADLPPEVSRAVRLALRLFERLPFPWRFSRLSLEARQEYLAKMEGARFAPYRDLMLLGKLLAMMGWARDERVQAAAGFEARCAVAEGSPAPRSAPLGSLEPLGDGEECDVAIIGSGAGGAAAAVILAEAGLDVVVLEQGPHVGRHDYPTDPLEALPLLYRDAGMTIATGRPAIPVPVGRAVGGTTVINSGTCFRAPLGVLADWSRSAGVGWATSLDDEYEAAERMLQVTPVDTDLMGRNGQLCMEGARAIGASGGPISRNAGRCVQCSSCPVGCRIDAKRAMHVSYLPRAVAAGARVRAGVEALQVRIEDGRATGVICRAGSATSAVEAAAARNGAHPSLRSWELRARTVISAGGAFGTPELLMRSGVRNRHLGSHLHVHPAAWIGARYEQEVRGWEGIMQSYYVDEWESRRILLEATFTPLSFGGHWLPGVGPELMARIRDYGKIASIGVHLHDRSEGRVGRSANGSLRLSYRLRADETADLQFGIARAAEIHFAAGATEVYPNVGPVQVITRDRLADFEATRLKPADLRLEAFHPMSTARMSSDPGEGVTGADGSVHGVEGLYVCDAGLLPTSVGVNPMMTIIACSAHVARGLAGELC
ncbi:MAG: FAD-binding protein [Solirubrobacterales bacterium]|nr:FAD-binding protein [Solirubrobacterales bacterium]